MRKSDRCFTKVITKYSFTTSSLCFYWKRKAFILTHKMYLFCIYFAHHIYCCSPQETELRALCSSSVYWKACLIRSYVWSHLNYISHLKVKALAYTGCLNSPNSQSMTPSMYPKCCPYKCILELIPQNNLCLCYSSLTKDGSFII